MDPCKLNQGYLFIDPEEKGTDVRNTGILWTNRHKKGAESACVCARFTKTCFCVNVTSINCINVCILYV